MKIRTNSRGARAAAFVTVAFLEMPGFAPALAADIPTTGKDAYERGCASCHASGASGAPVVGDHAAWGLRIAQGRLTLYRHTILGQRGMPARGGTQWPDATIRMAVDYMVSLNK